MPPVRSVVSKLTIDSGIIPLAGSAEVSKDTLSPNFKRCLSASCDQSAEASKLGFNKINLPTKQKVIISEDMRYNNLSVLSDLVELINKDNRD